jgi:hypothetical protein
MGYPHYSVDCHEYHELVRDFGREPNVGGYIGDSTRGEIEYAEKVGRPIIYLEDVA